MNDIQIVKVQKLTSDDIKFLNQLVKKDLKYINNTNTTNEFNAVNTWLLEDIGFEFYVVKLNSNNNIIGWISLTTNLQYISRRMRSWYQEGDKRSYVYELYLVPMYRYDTNFDYVLNQLEANFEFIIFEPYDDETTFNQILKNRKFQLFTTWKDDTFRLVNTVIKTIPENMFPLTEPATVTLTCLPSYITHNYVKDRLDGWDHTRPYYSAHFYKYISGNEQIIHITYDSLGGAEACVEMFSAIRDGFDGSSNLVISKKPGEKTAPVGSVLWKKYL